MTDPKFAEKLFKAAQAAQRLDDQFSDHIAKALGFDPQRYWTEECKDPKTHGFDDWSYDYYDESYELHGCSNHFSWPYSAHEYMKSLGFRMCWINYIPGTPSYEKWPNGRTPPDLEGAPEKNDK